MKIIDKEGRIFGKINLIDFLLLLVILLIVGFSFYKFALNGWVKKTETDLKVTVYVDDISPEIAEKIKNVNEVYFGRGLVKTPVEKVEVIPMPEGARRPDFVEVKITMSDKGYLYNEGAYFGNQRVSLGKKIWLRSFYELETTVLAIEKK